MAPTKLKLAPFVVKSEPTTPIYATTALPEEAPDSWFAPISFKEKVAIMTFEHIPNLLHSAHQDHAASTPTQFFTPRLLPLLDRMKFHFSRSMAMARAEAENGIFDWRGIPGRLPTSPLKPRIFPADVMSGIHVEIFFAGIEEVKCPEKDNRVVYRRYWRILEPPEGLEEKLGGVVSSGSVAEHHLNKGVKPKMMEHWHDTPKVLVAEFLVGADGRSLAGRMLENWKNMEADQEKGL